MYVACLLTHKPKSISPIYLTLNWPFLHFFGLLPGSSPCCWPAEISSFCISGDYWLDSFWWFQVFRKNHKCATQWQIVKTDFQLIMRCVSRCSDNEWLGNTYLQLKISPHLSLCITSWTLQMHASLMLICFALVLKNFTFSSVLENQG